MIYLRTNLLYYKGIENKLRYRAAKLGPGFFKEMIVVYE